MGDDLVVGEVAVGAVVQLELLADDRAGFCALAGTGDFASELFAVVP